MTINDELAVNGLNSTVEDSVSWVIFVHVDHVVQIDEGVIDGHNVNILASNGGTGDETKIKVKENLFNKHWLSFKVSLRPKDKFKFKVYF